MPGAADRERVRRTLQDAADRPPPLPSCPLPFGLLARNPAPLARVRARSADQLRRGVRGAPPTGLSGLKE
jgi:hypothetical protein